MRFKHEDRYIMLLIMLVFNTVNHRYTNLKGIGNGKTIRVTHDVIYSLYYPDRSEY